ncbi:FHA domain-containing protein [Pseudobacteroides cellulosolvens]|uniref:FHA domain containing protein n=1 Tax=Pseudobacteroides cellulosolvens ATCC 35603 = DSM 2933 TaxID=398512 RepID=A0A0L6JVT7_9FIRM|nr:FHA domain-containing protein [Pseudobacteroides cellulosolvens]KNY29986.1 FHA domain containing protein [Pseudobacteroides cellulosolvens ATCC 35603 = DSM 2933]
MFEILSSLLKYLFVTVIYLFIYGVIRLIYLDIKSASSQKFEIKKNIPYLKLINIREQFDFKIEEIYMLGKDVDIGRSAKNKIIIKDPYMSTNHARFSYKDRTYFVEDLGSTNGTFVNGRQVKNTAMPIKDGDKIRIGQVDFLFVYGG